MKVKNVMFTGFAAAILGGACGAADAATYTLASKEFVTEQVKLKQDKLTAGDGINITEDNTISAQFKTAGGETVTMGDLAESIDAVDQKFGDLGESETVAEALAGKQDTLTTEQQAVVNSGLTAEDVAKIGTTATAVTELTQDVADVLDVATAAGTAAGNAQADVDALESIVNNETTGLGTKVSQSVYDAHLESQKAIDEKQTADIASNLSKINALDEASGGNITGIVTRLETLEGEGEGSVAYDIAQAIAGEVSRADNAYQPKGDYQAAGNYVTDSEFETYQGTVTDALAGKQATIEDLETIRSGAAKGATAMQSIADGSVTKAMLDTTVQASLDKADSAVQPAAIEDMLTTTVAADTYATKTSLNDYVTNEALTQAGYQNAEQVQEKIDAGKFLTSDQLGAGTYLVSTNGTTVSYTSVAVVDGEGNEMNLIGGAL